MVTYDEFKQFYKKFPKGVNKFYYQQFPEGNKSTIRNYKYRCRIAEKTVATHDATNNEIKNKGQEKVIPPSPQPPSQDKQMSTGDIVKSVNDPVGFVFTLITEELVKTRDIKWATLFVAVLKESKKLDYSTQQEIEWSNQAKSLSIEELVEKVALKGSISKNISRRLDKADSTSALDSFSDA